MSHPTKPVVKNSFILPADTFLELAKKTEEYLWKHPECIILDPYKKVYEKKQVFNRIGKRNHVGDEIRVRWIVKIGVVE